MHEIGEVFLTFRTETRDEGDLATVGIMVSRGRHVGFATGNGSELIIKLL